MKGWLRLTALLLLQLTRAWAVELKIVRGMRGNMGQGPQLSNANLGRDREEQADMLGNVLAQVVGR